MDKVLEKIERYLLYTIVFLFPIIVLSISSNPYTLIKLAVLTFGIGFILLVKSARILVSGKLEFSNASFDLAVFILLTAYLLSAIFQTPNKMEAFLLPGTCTTVLVGALLYYLLNQLRVEEKRVVTTIFFASGVIFAVIELLAALGLFAKIPQLPAFMKIASFNPEGGFLPAVVFLATLIPIGVVLLISAKQTTTKALLGISNLIVILAIAISIYNLLPGMPFSPRFPSFAVSWSIAVDSLKEQPFLGAGPGNYLTAFNRFRPLSFNVTDLWAIKFATANDFYLTLLTETGMLGAAGVIVLLLAIYRALRDKFRGKLAKWNYLEDAPFSSLIILLILLAIFPATTISIVTIFILLALSAKTQKTTLNLSTQAISDKELEANSSQKIATRLPAFLTTLPIIAGVLVFGYFASRGLYAEYKFKKSLDALLRNEGATTYNVMGQAINLNPYVDRYHATYSRVNLALVNAIATKKDITDVDRSNIAQLIQQAISESKATVALNPLRAGNWELLARTYQAIIPLAQGADAFAAQSMRQAVVLDPVNPLLRVGLGGMYYAKGDFDNAISVFQLAVATKPDLANSHYNLAFALREKGQIDQAIQQMTFVLSLVDKNSQDYQLAKNTLDDLEKKLPTAKEGTQNLIPPPGSEKPVLKPPLELPAGSQPPEAPITLTPSPTPTETP